MHSIEIFLVQQTVKHTLTQTAKGYSDMQVSLIKNKRLLRMILICNYYSENRSQQFLIVKDDIALITIIIIKY